MEPALHRFGATRSALKHDHLLHTPDAFIRTPLPGAPGVEFLVHVGPRVGARFTQMTAEFAVGGRLGATGAQRFVYGIEGELEVIVGDPAQSVPRRLAPGGFAYLPQGVEHSVTARTIARAAVIEKRYEPLPETAPPAALFGHEDSIAAKPLMGDDGLQVKNLMPDGPPWDFAVNTMTYAPGASLAMVEAHVMEHGLLMLEGGGIYRLGESWYPVAAGDFIWMGPYCPQWFGALGKVPAKYLIYKDWYRHPLGA